MKKIVKHFKVIANFLAALILFQSCIAYRKTTYTAQEASTFEKERIKITSMDGKVYKLRWIEIQNDYIISIENTKRELIDKDEIETVIIDNPITYTTLDKALEHTGTVYIRTKDFKKQDQLYNYTFVRLEDHGDSIRGYVKTENDTTNVYIPISQIEEIKVENKTKSTVGNIAIGLGAVYIILFTIAIIEMSNQELGWDFSQ